jgi:hypothetical protein
METIKIGEEQPVPCDHCGDYEGYQVSDYLKTHFTMSFEGDGSFMHSFYSEYQPLITAQVTPYCSNCGTRLRFKMERNKEEVLVEKPVKSRYR